MILFRALLHLQGSSTPHSVNETLAALSQLGLNTEAFGKVYGLRRQHDPLGRAEVDALFRQYLSEIESVVKFVEKTNVAQP